MKRYKFDAVVTKQLPRLRAMIKRMSIPYDDGQDVISNVLDKLRHEKFYLRLGKRRESYIGNVLINRVRWGVSAFKRKQVRRSKYMSILPDDVGDAVTVPTIYDVEVTECPFCFRGPLNEFGACCLCHTIIPRHVRRQRIVVPDVKSLAVDFEYEKQADIAKALAALTELERKVVQAVILGNESLESFAELLGQSKASVFRIWISAKGKLQHALLDYAEFHVSRKPLSTKPSLSWGTL